MDEWMHACMRTSRPYMSSRDGRTSAVAGAQQSRAEQSSDWIDGSLPSVQLTDFSLTHGSTDPSLPCCTTPVRRVDHTPPPRRSPLRRALLNHSTRADDDGSTVTMIPVVAPPLAQSLPVASAPSQPTIPSPSAALMAGRRDSERVQRFAYPPASTPQAYLCVTELAARQPQARARGPPTHVRGRNWESLDCCTRLPPSASHSSLPKMHVCLCCSLCAFGPDPRHTANSWAKILTPTSTV